MYVNPFQTDSRSENMNLTFVRRLLSFDRARNATNMTVTWLKNIMWQRTIMCPQHMTQKPVNSKINTNSKLQCDLSLKTRLCLPIATEEYRILTQINAFVSRKNLIRLDNNNDSNQVTSLWFGVLPICSAFDCRLKSTRKCTRYLSLVLYLMLKLLVRRFYANNAIFPQQIDSQKSQEKTTSFLIL